MFCLSLIKVIKTLCKDTHFFLYIGIVCRTIEEGSPNGRCCYLVKPIFLDEVLLILSESQCGIRLLAVGAALPCRMASMA